MKQRKWTPHTSVAHVTNLHVSCRSQAITYNISPTIRFIYARTFFSRKIQMHRDKPLKLILTYFHDPWAIQHVPFRTLHKISALFIHSTVVFILPDMWSTTNWTSQTFIENVTKKPKRSASWQSRSIFPRMFCSYLLGMLCQSTVVPDTQINKVVIIWSPCTVILISSENSNYIQQVHPITTSINNQQNEASLWF